MATKTEVQQLQTRITELESELATVKLENNALKGTIGLDEKAFLRVTKEVGDKVSTLGGDIIGEIVGAVTGDPKKKQMADRAATEVLEQVANLSIRYLAIPIRQLILGENIWDGKNNWFLFDLGSDVRDEDLTTLEHPIGHYPHNAPGAPTANDGAYGERADGDLAATAYELYWRPDGSDPEDWTKSVPAHVIIKNPHDPALLPGVYAMRYDQGAGDNGPDPKYSTGRFNNRNPRGAWMIVQKTAKGELRAVQCFYGARSWVHREEG